MDLLNNQMQQIPGVVATETLISLEQSIKREIPIASKSVVAAKRRRAAKVVEDDDIE